MKFKKLILITIICLNYGCSSNDSQNTESPTSNLPIFNPNITYGVLTDIDGTNYKTVQIGTQTWMAENLNVTRYRNGDPIPEVQDNTQWSNLSSGAWCNNGNNPQNGLLYRKLYNWYTVNDSRKLAPIGWHIPTDAEWTTLTNYLGGENVAGGKLKEIGITHWKSPNTSATNESGFTALPGAYRHNLGDFSSINGVGGDWWSLTSGSTSQAWSRYIHNDQSSMVRSLADKKIGYSVRCIKD